MSWTQWPWLQDIKPNGYKLLPEGVFNHAMFYLLHSPGLGPPLLTSNNGHSFWRYHPEPVLVTDSEQVSQKQPESLHHDLSGVTVHVANFPRFVHLSVLWLVINTAVLVLCMWKNERQSGYQMLSFNAGCTHLLLLYFLCMHLPPPHPTAFLVCIMS